MGKFLVIALAAVFCCRIVYGYVPSVAHEAFTIHGNSIPWVMLLCVGFVWGGYKLSGK